MSKRQIQRRNTNPAVTQQWPYSRTVVVSEESWRERWPLFLGIGGRGADLLQFDGELAAATVSPGVCKAIVALVGIKL